MSAIERQFGNFEKDFGRRWSDHRSRLETSRLVSSLFAPGAMTTAVNLTRNGAPELAYMKAEEWVQGIEKALARMESIKLDLLAP